MTRTLLALHMYLLAAGATLILKVSVHPREWQEPWTESPYFRLKRTDDLRGGDWVARLQSQWNWAASGRTVTFPQGVALVRLYCFQEICLQTFWGMEDKQKGGDPLAQKKCPVLKIPHKRPR